MRFDVTALFFLTPWITLSFWVILFSIYPVKAFVMTSICTQSTISVDIFMASSGSKKKWDVFFYFQEV